MPKGLKDSLAGPLTSDQSQMSKTPTFLSAKCLVYQLPAFLLCLHTREGGGGKALTSNAKLRRYVSGKEAAPYMNKSAVNAGNLAPRNCGIWKAA